MNRGWVFCGYVRAGCFYRKKTLASYVLHWDRNVVTHEGDASKLWAIAGW